MADALQNRDLERFVHAFALFQQRFMHGADAAVARPSAGTAAASATAPAAPAAITTGAPPRRPAPSKSPRRAA
jgi:hypothetical protein